MDIVYTVSGDIAAAVKEQGAFPSLKVTATDNDTGATYTATSLSGDLSFDEGTHSIVWDMDGDGSVFTSSNVVFSVSCETTPATYCVIDLSAGANASSYPVAYLVEPPSGGFNTDEYKTTKLVLKRIEAGTFIMGEDQTDESHRVTLTRPFSMGLFEVTQKQYQLVTGSNPSNFKGDKLPVEKVSYNAIRGASNGAKWPSSDAVDSGSFLGKLQARTGLAFDLPTEAQWEYACRTGTTTTYSYGNSASGNYMWYKDNSSSQTHEVGTKSPNFWGLYDMHGNVWERCLDWYNSTLSYGTDPKGSSSGSNRVYRGGSWDVAASRCSSSSRSNNHPSIEYYSIGFRLSRPLPADPYILSGASAATTINLLSVPVITPENGTIFSDSLSVSISCSSEGATIRYTTNGTDPTEESPVYQRFRIRGKTTVKAVAEKDGLLSDVAVAEYALGQCENPVISLADGTEFAHSNQVVSIQWNNDGVLRYTTDGSDPTPESAEYNGPLSFSESVVLKAKVFSNDFFDSAVVTSTLSRVWLNVATPTITAAPSFTGSKTSVSLSCATEGATIRYTTDGNDPNSHATRYTGPFYVTDSCTVKAYAVCADYLNSEIAAFAIEKVWGIGDTMGDPDQSFTTGGDLPFFRVDDATAPLGEAMRSGAITHNQTSTMTTTVDGAGTISFQWKTSCEDSGGQYDWDHAEFEVDGTVVAKLDGETDWRTVSHDISGDGPHTLLWRYVKDDVESEGEDCCRVADFRWTPETQPTYTETQTTPVPVPYAWLRGYCPEISDEYEAYEATALAMAANQVNTVWECYVAGISPVDEDARFRATIELVDGRPVVSHDPPLSAGEEAKREFRILGAKTLDGEWDDVTEVVDRDAAGYRFFKVTVRMK